MTKQRIEQYVSLQREIAMLEDQIHRAECTGEFVVDSVKGSGTEKPYTMRNVAIKGYTSERVLKLNKRKAAREKERVEIERFTEQIDDVVLRQIITWRYIDGKTALETASLCGYSVRQVHRLVTGFFEKMADGVT